MSKDRDLLGRYDGRPVWPTYAAVLIAALLGSIAVPVQVLLQKSSQAENRQQDQHNEQVVRDVARVTHNNQSVICHKINALLPPADAVATPCPDVER